MIFAIFAILDFLAIFIFTLFYVLFFIIKERALYGEEPINKRIHLKIVSERFYHLSVMMLFVIFVLTIIAAILK